MYLDLKNKQALVDKLNDLESCEKILKSLEVDLKDIKEATWLAALLGDDCVARTDYPNAERFYQQAFGWDQNNEEMFIKLFKVLGK